MESKIMMKYFLAFVLCFAGLCLPENFALAQEMETSWPNGGLTLQEAYAQTAEGGTLTIKPGTHEVPETLVVRKNIKIVGESANREETILKGGKENVLCIASGSAEIKNLTFQNHGLHDDPKGWAVWVQTRENVFENCLFTSATGTGLGIGKKYYSLLSAAAAVTDCAARGCGTAGFLVINASSGNFTNCEANGNSGVGLQILGSNTVSIAERCRFNDGGDFGIVVGAGASGTFTECEVSGNAKDGISGRYGNGNLTAHKCRFTNGNAFGVQLAHGRGTFTDCEFRGNAKAGIGFFDGGKLTVEGCRFLDGKDVGLQIVNWNKTMDPADGNIIDCEFTGNAKAGMYIEGPKADPTVGRCRFTDGKDAGIHISSGACGQFTDCEASGNTKAGMWVQSSRWGRGGFSNPTVHKCRFHHGKASGIFVDDSDGTFTECEADGNAGCGILVNGASPTVKKCRFTNNGSDGIAVGYLGQAKFTECEVSGNRGSGIYVTSSDDLTYPDPVVEGCRILNNGKGVVMVEYAGGTFRNNTLENQGGNWHIESRDCEPVREGNSPNE